LVGPSNIGVTPQDTDVNATVNEKKNDIEIAESDNVIRTPKNSKKFFHLSLESAIAAATEAEA